MQNTFVDRSLGSQSYLRFSPYPILLFFSQRLMLSLLGVLLFTMGLVPGSGDPILQPNYGIEPIDSGLSGALLGVWQRFDVIHYLRIAESGYSSPDLVPFFPLFPLSSKLVGNLFGGNYLLGAMLVSNIACLLLLCLFYTWIESEWHDERLSKRTLLFFLWFPTSFFLFIPYTESLFLFFAVFTIRAARKDQWLFAGVMGGLATLTRISGVILTAVILVEWAINRRKEPLKKSILTILSSLLPAVAYFSLSLWRSLAGLPSLLEVQESNWFRVPAWPLQSVFEAFVKSFEDSVTAIELMDLALVLIMLFIGILVLRKLPLSLGIYHWGLLLLTLSQTRIGQPLFGQARFALELFPAYIVLAQVTQHPVLRRLLLLMFMILNLLLARWFIMGRWVG